MSNQIEPEARTSGSDIHHTAKDSARQETIKPFVLDSITLRNAHGEPVGVSRIVLGNRGRWLKERVLGPAVTHLRRGERPLPVEPLTHTPVDDALDSLASRRAFTLVGAFAIPAGSAGFITYQLTHPVQVYAQEEVQQVGQAQEEPDSSPPDDEPAVVVTPSGTEVKAAQIWADSDARVLPLEELPSAEISELTGNNEPLIAQVGSELAPPNPQLESFLKQIQDLEQNPNLSPSKRQTIKDLVFLVQADDMNGSTVGINPMGFSLDEILEYAKSPDERIFNTFRVWTTPDKKDSVVISTGPRPEGKVQGFSFSRGNIETVEAALNWLYQADPIMIKTLKSYGLKVISGNLPVFNITGQSAGFSKPLGLVAISEFGGDPPSAQDRLSVLSHAYSIFIETRHLFMVGQKNQPGRLHLNSGIDKAFWADNWALQHKNAFVNNSKDNELRVWQSWIRHVVEHYTQFPENSGDFYN